MTQSLDRRLLQLRIPLAAVILGACSCSSRESTRSDLDNRRRRAGLVAADTHRSRPALTGISSCSAAACHGGLQPERTLSSRSFTIWYDHDPHAKAAITLYDPRSERMVALLGKEVAGATHAFESALCLRCHSSSSYVTDIAAPRTLVLEGVGCEGCHGAASQWRDAHHDSRWDGLTCAEKQAIGFADLKNSTTLARTCVPCHVGSTRQQVNHEMIAAGHPPLRFEFGAYFEMVPRHWADDNARDVTGNLLLQQWVIGQLAAAAAALEVLEARAAAAQKERHAAWPEFSEHDCFACHRRLGAPPGTKGISDPGPPRTWPRWGTWYFPLLAQISGDGGFGRPAADVAMLLQGLTRSMERSIVPDAGRIRQDSAVLRMQINAWLDSIDGKGALEFDLRNMHELILASVGTPYQETFAAIELDWHRSAQVLLALSVLDRATRDSLHQGIKPTVSDRLVAVRLEQLRRMLEFPAGYENPRRVDAPGIPPAQHEDYAGALREALRLIGRRFNRIPSENPKGGWVAAEAVGN